MFVILKINDECNFSCTFCGADNVKTNNIKYNKLDKRILDLLYKINPTYLVLSGGDPLLVDPHIYYDLHELLPKTNISATTNLKDFYENPTKWSDIFKESWFNVSTSFHYGNNRLWDKNTIYNEEIFFKVIDKWNQYIVNKHFPPFISVIDYTNEDKAIDHIYLAKKINGYCKLNRMMKIGKQSSSQYPLYKLFKIYFKIIDMGLEQYEEYCSRRFENLCPINCSLLCNHNIKCIFIDKNDNLKITNCVDCAAINLYQEDLCDIHENLISNECSYCELMGICNGCHINRIEYSEDTNFCKNMKNIKNDIINYGWNTNVPIIR